MLDRHPCGEPAEEWAAIVDAQDRRFEGRLASIVILLALLAFLVVAFSGAGQERVEWPDSAEVSR